MMRIESRWKTPSASGRETEKLYWKERWVEAYDDSNPPFHRRFVGSKMNIAYNALDVHARSGRGNKAALIWVTPTASRGFSGTGTSTER